MKDLLTAVSKKSYIGRTLRNVIIAFVIVYVMIMSALLPVSTLYFESRAKEEDTFVGVLLEGEKIPIEEIEVGVEELDTQEISYVKMDKESGGITRVAEDESARTIYSKEYIMSDGSRTVEQYSKPIHYVEKGVYKEIDNSLVSTEVGDKKVVENKSNFFKTKFSKDEKEDSSVEVELPGHTFKWSLRMDKEKNRGVEKLSNQAKIGNVKYTSFYKDIDIEYSVNSLQIKEDIILQKPQTNNSFYYEIEVEDLVLALRDDGSISCRDFYTNEEIMTIPKAYMIDENGEESYDIEYKLEMVTRSRYKLSVLPSESWLSAKDRKYPVTIDPQITFNSNAQGLYSLTDDTPYDTFLRTVSKDTWSYIYFPIDSIPKEATITSTTLSFEYLGVNTNSDLLHVYQALGNWKDQTTGETRKHALGMSNGDDNTIATFISMFLLSFPMASVPFETTLSSATINLDITNIVRGWHQGSFDNHGVILYTGFGENSEEEFTGLLFNKEDVDGSSLVVTINYRVNVGLEDYWTYDSFDVGRAGSGHVNQFNDQLTFVHKTVSLGGELPITLSHIYNDILVDKYFDVNDLYANMKVGTGWKLNYQQVLLPIEVIEPQNSDNRYKYVYVDADGTYHRFWQQDENSAIIDEDGLGYSLSIDATTINSYYTITDANKNLMKFYQTGRLYRVEDANGNYNEVIYDSEGRITEIIDRVGRKIKLEYLSNNFLIKIHYDLNALPLEGESEVYNKTVQLEYVGATVYKFLYNDGKKTFYSYENGRTGRMTDVYNFDGYSVGFTFGSRIEDGDVIISRRITEYIKTVPETGPFEQTVTTNKTGQKRELLYYHGKTEIVNAKHNSAFVDYSEETAGDYRAGNLFNTIVFDVYGRAVNSYSFIKEELVSNAYFYDGMQIPTATVTDVLDENNDPTGDTTIEDETTTAVNAGALDKNKLTMSSFYSAEAKNYLLNASFENGWSHWSNAQSNATPKCRFAINSYKPLYGDRALVMMLTQVAPQTLSVSQSVALEKGTYTLSGYIRLDGNLHRYGTSSYGAYLQASYGDTIKKTERITTETISVNGGYRLVSVTFTLSEAQTIVVKAILENCATFAWFDGLQLIKSDAPSYVSYNMLSNGGFSVLDEGELEDWTIINDSTSGVIAQTNTAESDVINDGVALSIHNLMRGGYIAVIQDVYLKKSVSENYVLSAWANSKQTNDSNSASLFGIAVENRSTEEAYFVPFDRKVKYWQQAVLPFTISSNGKYRIHLLYSNCLGFVTFDNVCLIASDTVNYRYNEYGILESSKGADGNEYVTNVSENGTIIEKTLVVGSAETILEETRRDNNYNVISSSNVVTGVQNSFSYDSYGNMTESIVKNYTPSSTGAQIVNTVNYGEFNEEFQQIITDTDSRGFQAISTYDGMMGILNRTTFADDSYKTYGYNATTELLNGVGVKSSDGTITDSIIYTYDDNYRLTQVRYKNQRFIYAYDEWGRVLEVDLYITGGVNTTLIENTYNTYGSTLKTSKNKIFSYTETYGYDTYGNLTSISTFDGRDGSWTYNASGQLVKSVDEEGAVLYQYDGLGRLIVASTRSGSSEYSRQVEEYKYDSKNRLTAKTTYSRVRDEEAHPESQDLLASSASLTTTYTGNNIFRMWNWGIIRVRYDYSAGRTSRENNQWLDTSTHSGGETVLYTRDSYGNLLYKTYYPYTTGNVGSAIRVVYPQYTAETTTYTYQNADDSATIKKISWGDGYYENYGYDELQRVNSKDILNSSGTTIVNEDYTFLSGRTDKENSTTTFVHTKTVNGITFTMSYDSLGRITEIVDSRYANPVKYYYDIYGSLYREDNPYSNQTIVYLLDSREIRRGTRYYNYTNSEELGDPISGLNYTYSSGVLIGDNVNGAQHVFNSSKLLYTKYNKTALRWSGNVLSQYGSNMYFYDINGLRYAKYDGSTTTSFFREGDTLIRQKNSTTEIWFYYDNAGAIEGIKYNGTRYFYLTNPLGDVIGIIDTSGNVVVTYTYDAWGNILSTSGTLSSTLGVDNPIRYRGYYYDVESGFYYLNSRYYDPHYGQFISIDSVESGDLFGYCDNNPVNAVDRTGQWLDTALDVVSLGFSVHDMVKDPSWENAGWLALDVVCLAVPFMSGAGALKIVSKGDDLVDAIRAVDKIDDAVDAGKVTKRAQDVAEGFKLLDNSQDTAKITIRALDNGGAITKSTKSAGKQIHDSYFKFIDAKKGQYFKNQALPETRLRPDFVDVTNKTIYELKPNNQRSIARGEKQLLNYISKAESFYGGIWKGVLDLY